MSALTLSQLESWDTRHLDRAATEWPRQAQESDVAFDRHLKSLDAPGGTAWTGVAKTAAYDGAVSAQSVVRKQGAVVVAAGGVAADASAEQQALKRAALGAVADAQNAGFTVSDDLSVTDARSGGSDAERAQRTAIAQQHQQHIRWYAAQLEQSEQEVIRKLSAKTAELQGHRLSQRNGDALQVRPMDNETPAPKPPPTEVMSGSDVHARLDPLPDGKNFPVKELPTDQAIRNEFGTLTKHAQKIDDPNYPRGDRYQLPDGTKIGLRESSKSGGPAIDVTYSDGSRTKLHTPVPSGGVGVPPEATSGGAGSAAPRGGGAAAPAAPPSTTREPFAPHAGAGPVDVPGPVKPTLGGVPGGPGDLQNMPHQVQPPEHGHLHIPAKGSASDFEEPDIGGG